MNRAAVFAVLCALPVWATGPAKGSADEVAKQAGKTVDATGQYVSEKKDEFEKRVGGKLDELKRNLSEVRKQAERDQHRAQKQISELVKDADSKGKEADRKLDELKRSTGDAWRDLKTGVEKAVDEFDRGVDRVKK